MSESRIWKLAGNRVKHGPGGKTIARSLKALPGVAGEIRDQLLAADRASEAVIENTCTFKAPRGIKLTVARVTLARKTRCF